MESDHGGGGKESTLGVILLPAAPLRAIPPFPRPRDRPGEAVAATLATMVDGPAAPPEPRRILKLAREDRTAAAGLLAGLPLEQQVALVCETPVSARAELLDLLPAPEHAIPLLPEAELCFTVKAIGLADAVWILEHATPEQVVACVDLDAWSGFAPDRAQLDAWMDALVQTGPDALLRGVHALDAELLVLHLRSRMDVELRPVGDEDWQPPDGAQTLDGQFYLSARAEGDDLASVLSLLHTLFERDYWTYFRLLQGVIWELESDSEEWALRWRSGRLEDLGFPSWNEAMELYGYLPPQRLAELPADARALDVSPFHLPVWIPQLPAEPGAHPTLFRAIAALSDEERRACFYALVGLANRVAVADKLPLAEPDSLPTALAKALRFVDAGLAFVAADRKGDPAEVLRHLSMQRLYRVGANLDPKEARP